MASPLCLSSVRHLRFEVEKRSRHLANGRPEINAILAEIPTFSKSKYAFPELHVLTTYLQKMVVRRVAFMHSADDRNQFWVERCHLCGLSLFGRIKTLHEKYDSELKTFWAL